MPRKSVLMVIVDAFATRVVEPAMHDGHLPSFARIAQRGTFVPRCWSMFPSITPAATATLHTGRYPREHGVAGAFWFDPKTDRVNYFGDDVWAILAEGPGKYFRDFQLTLNFDHLRSETVYETVRRQGRTAACVNSMWFRADVPHEVHTPLLLKLIPGVKPAREITGPDVLCLADFVTSTPPGSDRPLSAPGGLRRRFGFHDETTAAYLLDLASRGPLPDLTVAYFPNNDFESHARGPFEAFDALRFVDETLGKLFETSGGIDAFLERTAVLVTGDHSQSDTARDDSARPIDLDQTLAGFSVVPAGQPWTNGEQVMACPNMRAAQVYVRGGDEALKRRVVAALLAEPGVDQVLRAEPSPARPERWVVETADRGTLTFRVGDAGPNVGRDEFGTTWSWDGDLAAVDGTNTHGMLRFGDYPNAFERIAGGFFDESGHAWATARLGREFRLPKTQTHPGGSHGSLHALDSTSPLFAAGLPEGVVVPSPVRTIDFTPLALAAIGLEPPFPPGAGRPPGAPG